MFESNNTPTHFECEIDNLYYGTVERAISRYFNMGYPSSSDMSPELPEGICDIYTLVCDRKSGKFSVSAYLMKSGKYQLSVSLQGKLHEV